MDYAAIRADYCNIKNIQGRKTIQIILEIPIERAHQLYDSLGWPNAHEPKKVVIALLNENTNG